MHPITNAKKQSSVIKNTANAIVLSGTSALPTALLTNKSKNKNGDF